MKDRGVALLSVLLLLVALFIGSATLFFTIFLDVHSTSNGDAAREALYGAEAGIHHVWSLLGRAPDFSEAASWPDGAPPFGEGAGAWPITVRVSAGPADALTARSEAVVHRDATAVVEAIFHRAPTFRPPGAVLLDSVTAGARDGEVTVSVDRAETEGGIGAIVAEDPATADFWTSIDPSWTRTVIGPSGLRPALARIDALAHAVVSGPVAFGTWGSAEAPEIVEITGVAEITGIATAVGILFADRPLRVSGELSVEGLLLAPDGLVVTGELRVRGAIWVGEMVDVTSSGLIGAAYDPAALDRLDGIVPGVLPREATLQAWRESW